MSDIDPIVRIVTFETPSGTNYIAQRKVWKTRWFRESGWVWEPFAKVYTCSHYHSGFTTLSSLDMGDSKFRNRSYAEYACAEWLRIQSSGGVIKTF